MSSQFNDTDDEDVALHTRRSVAESYAQPGRQAEDVADSRPPEREVTLNTGIVLALFFALALLCGVFFSFGYSMGRKSVPPAIASDNDPGSPAADTTPAAASVVKPAPGSPVQSVPEYVPPSGAEKAAAKPAASPLPTASPDKAAAIEADKPKTSALPARTPAPVVRSAASPVTAAPIPSQPVSGAGTTYVQIAAVSHQEDADVLLSALRRKGYTVLTRSDANDRLIHVQIGPFSNRKEADAMRQKLAGDGYNAFLK